MRGAGLFLVRHCGDHPEMGQTMTLTLPAGIWHQISGGFEREDGMTIMWDGTGSLEIGSDTTLLGPGYDPAVIYPANGASDDANPLL
jgi:hypothetical protein